MERQLWMALYRIVMELGKTHSFARKQISDAWIVLTFMWSVLHDRPRAWACDLKNWPREEHWHRIPSATTLNRRLRTIPVLTLMEQTSQKLRDLFPSGALKFMDGKPLPVGGYSKDRDATYGHAAGLEAVGYKIHVLRDAKCPAMPDQWKLAGLRCSEQAIAPQLLQAHAMTVACMIVHWTAMFGYLVVDNGYDTNALYELAASLLNWQVIAPPKATAAGLGHREHSPYRLRGLDLARGCHDQNKRSKNNNVNRHHPLNPLGRAGVPLTFGQSLLNARGGIERSFGLWGNWGGGLGQLPNWVRRPRRVALWVAGKMILNGVREAAKQGLIIHEKQRLAA
jgi:hypothetical protein